MKNVAFILTVLVLSGIAGAAVTDWADDFEALSLGPLGGQNGWSTVLTANNSSVEGTINVVTDPLGSGSQVVEFHFTGGLEMTMTQPFSGDADDNAFIMTMDCYIPDAGVNYWRLYAAPYLDGGVVSGDTYARMYSNAVTSEYLTWTLAVNDTANDITWVDPTGATVTLVAGTVSRWIGTSTASGSYILDATPVYMGISSPRGNGASTAGKIYLENFSIAAIPEPATMLLLGLGSLMGLRRRG